MTRGLPHAILMVRPNGSVRDALEMAAGILCPTQAENCSCGVCRRVREGIHPDVNVTDKSGKAILVDDVRAIRTDSQLAPVEGENKVYIIAHAQDMNPQAQNALLKTLEEPPSGVHFILECENPSALLSTVRSRCVVLSSNGGRQDPGEEATELAREFCAAAAKNDELELIRFAVEHDKMKRDEFIPFADAAAWMLRDALLSVCGAGKAARAPLPGLVRLPEKRLEKLCSLMCEYKARAKQNVGVGLILSSIPAKIYTNS